VNWLAALALTIGIALAAAALVIGLAKASTTPTDHPRAAHLRAADAVDQLVPGQIGDDDQWHRWRTIPVHIRRNANAENAATDPERTGQ
jgi:hypothetical protein